jgi:anti-sigma factor RsiW
VITCRELYEFLIDYVSGELPIAQRTEFERHLAVCPSCVAYLENYENTIALGKAAAADDQSTTELPEELLAAILATRGR